MLKLHSRFSLADDLTWGRVCEGMAYYTRSFASGRWDARIAHPVKLSSSS
ncbi:MAG: hypothetical protein ACI84R_000918 [Candidatus Azotimanducaceae bacterium]|jgi:hypothetical protein